MIRTLPIFIVLVPGASALAAGIAGGASTGSPAVTSLQFSVPYSFSNVNKAVDHAVIRCVAKFGVNTPPIASGQVVVMLNGQPRSGIALVAVTPTPGQKLSDAKHYSCGVELSDGKMAIIPQLGGGPVWAKAQPGSVFMVNGEIK